jgi:hypothetical protein
VGERHHLAAPRPGRRLEDGRQAVDDERVVAGGREGRGEPAEEALPPVADRGRPAVDGLAGAHDPGAVGDADRLVAEADPEHRDRRPGGAAGPHEVDGDARLRGRAGSGRDDDARRPGRQHARHGPVVVSRHEDRRPEAREEVREVLGERVVVVDEPDRPRRRRRGRADDPTGLPTGLPTTTRPRGHPLRLRDRRPGPTAGDLVHDPMRRVRRERPGGCPEVSSHAARGSIEVVRV